LIVPYALARNVEADSLLAFSLEVRQLARELAEGWRKQECRWFPRSSVGPHPRTLQRPKESRWSAFGLVRRWSVRTILSVAS
jgi:hypothetical protein